MSRRLRIAYFSPLPPSPSGITDYSRELLPHLAKLAEVSLFAEEDDSPATSWKPQLPVLPLATYAQHRWQFDAALFHIGNSQFHAGPYQIFLQYSGFVVLHDHSIHQLLASQTVGQGRFWPYLREMTYALGQEGWCWAQDVRQHTRPLPHFEVPLNDRLLDTALGVIVHSRYARDLIKQRSFACPVAVVSAPIARGTACSRRADFGLPSRAIVFGSFGMVSHTKQVERALQAFREVRNRLDTALYIVAGNWRDAGVDLPEIVQQLGLENSVRYTGFIPELEEFQDWISSVDVVVNLRYPTVGETSAVALRALAAGRPLIVCDHGWYSELPDDVCIKVPPLDDEALRVAMLRLAEDAELRQALGQRAQAYAAAVHAPARAAEAYVAFMERVLVNEAWKQVKG